MRRRLTLQEITEKLCEAIDRMTPEEKAEMRARLNGKTGATMDKRKARLGLQPSHSKCWLPKSSGELRLSRRGQVSGHGNWVPSAALQRRPCGTTPRFWRLPNFWFQSATACCWRLTFLIPCARPLSNRSHEHLASCARRSRQRFRSLCRCACGEKTGFEFNRKRDAARVQPFDAPNRIT